MQLPKVSGGVFVISAFALAGVVVTPSVPAAWADCTSAGGTTICSQGEVRGADTGQGPSGSSGPYVPYPCDASNYWYACDDYYWGINVDLDLGPGGPGGPNIGGGRR